MAEDEGRSARSTHSIRPAPHTLALAARMVIMGLLFLIVLWAPIPLGSNRPFFLNLLAFLTGAALLVWSVAAGLGVLRVSRHVASLWPAGLAVGAAIAIAMLQIVDLRAVDAVAGTQLAREYGHPIWQLAGDNLGAQLPVYISVNPAEADQAITKTLLYAGVFFLAFSLARRTHAARVLLVLSAVSAALCVAVGLAQAAGGMNFGAMLSGEQVRTFDRFSATFVNPNHFATYAGIGLIAALGLTYDALSKGIVTKRGRDIALRTATATILGPAMSGLASAFLLLGAVLVSTSRAGTVSMLAGCVALAAVLYFSERVGGGGRSGSSLGRNILAAIVIIGFGFASAPLLLRMEGASSAQDQRWDVAWTTADAITAAPVTGNGFGAFPDYYNLYAREMTVGTVNAAHSDYLEVLGDLGYIGGGALIFAPLYLAFLAVRGAFRRRKGRVYGAVAVAASTLCAVHAVFDFSLQIPAVGVLLYTVLGVGVAQAWRGDDEDAGDPRMSA
jgi:hypothetical protein